MKNTKKREATDALRRTVLDAMRAYMDIAVNDPDENAGDLAALGMELVHRASQVLDGQPVTSRMMCMVTERPLDPEMAEFLRKRGERRGRKAKRSASRTQSNTRAQLSRSRADG